MEIIGPGTVKRNLRITSTKKLIYDHERVDFTKTIEKRCERGKTEKNVTLEKCVKTIFNNEENRTAFRNELKLPIEATGAFYYFCRSFLEHLEHAIRASLSLRRERP